LFAAKAGVLLRRFKNTGTIGARSAVRRRMARRIWSAEQRRIRRGGKPNPALARLGVLIWVPVKAPPVIDMHASQDRGPTAKFLANLRAQTRRDGIGMIVDLSGVTVLRPLGAVLLLAELDRAYAGQPASSIRLVQCRDPVIHAVMCQVGIYVTDEGPLAESDREDVKHWRFATGVATEGVKGGTILEGYEGRLAEGLTSDLYAGIVEAMTNTVHHAYPDLGGSELRRFIGKRWWAISQERDGQLSIAICDLGIGIPRSLPRSASFSSGAVRAVWRGLGLDASDVSAIKVAVELGRTSTGKKGRGRGLSEIVAAANLSTEGRVLISSNKGVFTSFDGQTHAYNHSHSVRGTLIYWTVRIADQEASDDS